MKVKIKTWEAMEKEFGLDTSGDIQCRGQWFSTTLNTQIPSDRIVDLHVSPHGRFELTDPEWRDAPWLITPDMIEKVLDPYEEIAEKAQVQVSTVDDAQEEAHKNEGLTGLSGTVSVKDGSSFAEAHYPSALPKDPQARKDIPIYSGCLMYFPDALAAVAACSKAGNDQHNPGSPLHWDRSKSGDELDALTRHLMDAGSLDTDGLRHSAKVAWRALANLQKEIEGENMAGHAHNCGEKAWPTTEEALEAFRQKSREDIVKMMEKEIENDS